MSKKTKTHFECYKTSLYTASKRANPKPISVTPKQVDKKFSKSNYKCVYTDLPTETKSGGTYRSGTGSGANPMKTTIDRRNPKKGYTLNNIECTCWFVNQMKGDMPPSVFEAANVLIAFKQFEQFIDKKKLKSVERMLEHSISVVKRGK